MKNRFNAFREKLKTHVDTTHVVAASAGSIVGAAVMYHTMMKSPRTLRLCKAAYDALTTDQTNFVRFSNPKHEHAFRVSLEQWI